MHEPQFQDPEEPDNFPASNPSSDVDNDDESGNFVAGDIEQDTDVTGALSKPKSRYPRR